MKFLVDANVSYDLVSRLKSLQYEVIAVVEKFPSKVSDKVIFDTAVAEKALLITRDQDFTNTIRYPSNVTEGILFIRQGNLKAEDEIDLVLKAIERLRPDDLRGKLVTISRTGIRML